MNFLKSLLKVKNSTILKVILKVLLKLLELNPGEKPNGQDKDQRTDC